MNNSNAWQRHFTWTRNVTHSSSTGKHGNYLMPLPLITTKIFKDGIESKRCLYCSLLPSSKLQSSYSLFLYYDLLIIFLIVGLTEEVTLKGCCSICFLTPRCFPRVTVACMISSLVKCCFSIHLIDHWNLFVQILLCCTNFALLYKLCFVVQIVLCCTRYDLLYKCALLYKLCFVVQILLCVISCALLYKLCFVVQIVLCMFSKMI